MFCPSCGKSIPDVSKFCLHCGAPILKGQLTIKETPPIAVEVIGVRPIGPVEKRGFISKKVGRGIKFAFSLLDSEGNQTTSDGTVIAILESVGASLVYATHKIYKATMKEAYRRASLAPWNRIIKVKKSDFKWTTYTGSGVEIRKLSYEYVQMSPLIFLNQDLYYEMHIWFIAPDQRCLYSPSGFFIEWGVD